MSNKVNIASFSDDKTVVLWDVPSEKKLHSFTDHNVSFSALNYFDVGFSLFVNFAVSLIK